MNIAIIGVGSIGSALSQRLDQQGHSLWLGVRDIHDSKAAELALTGKQTRVVAVSDAVAAAEVVILAVPQSAIPTLAASLGDIKGKVILETTNAFGSSLPGYAHSPAAIKAITGNADVVKCFNTLGAENLAEPLFGSEQADTFVAGDSAKAKAVVQVLAKDMGFGTCYDLGGDESIPLLESLAQVWGALAYKGKLGRRLALKVLR